MTEPTRTAAILPPATAEALADTVPSTPAFEVTTATVWQVTASFLPAAEGKDRGVAQILVMTADPAGAELFPALRARLAREFHGCRDPYIVAVQRIGDASGTVARLRPQA